MEDIERALEESDLENDKKLRKVGEKNLDNLFKQISQSRSNCHEKARSENLEISSPNFDSKDPIDFDAWHNNQIVAIGTPPNEGICFDEYEKPNSCKDFAILGTRKNQDK